MPTTVVFTVNPDGGADYTSLQDAIDTEAEDLTVSDQIHVFRCSSSGTADSTAVTNAAWTGYVMDATRYVQIEVASGQEHGGAWNENVYRMERSDGGCLNLPTGAGVLWHIRVRGLQIRVIPTTGSTGRRCISGPGGIDTNSILDVQNCILRVSKTGGTSTDHNAVEILDNQWNPALFANCLVIMEGTDVGNAISREGVGATYVHNCGVVGATVAYTAGSATGTFQLKNCWAKGCTTFAANYDSSDYNSTDLGTATGGANDRVSQTFTFVDEGNGDYRPASNDAAIRGHGVDLSADGTLPITTDMEGVAVNSPPDIGPLNAEVVEPEGENRWVIRRAAA